MTNIDKKKSDEKPHSTYALTPYAMSNLVFKTSAISFTVSMFTQPFQALLTQCQMAPGHPSNISSSFFRSLYRNGFGSYILAGQKRGAVAVTHKQTNRGKEKEEEVESIPPKPWLGTLLFSQADLWVSNALTGKSKLEFAGIITKNNFKWTIPNFWQLTTVNWGGRSMAGFVNFAAIGFAGDYISSFYKFDNAIYNKLLGGATAGVFATFFTTLPNAYADRKLLASTVVSGHIVRVSAYTMFKQMHAHANKVGPLEAIKMFAKHNFLKEVALRSPQAALTFSIIFGMDHCMGTEPLKKVWPKPIAIAEEEPENASLGISKK